MVFSIADETNIFLTDALPQRPSSKFNPISHPKSTNLLHVHLSSSCRWQAVKGISRVCPGPGDGPRAVGRAATDRREATPGLQGITNTSQDMVEQTTKMSKSAALERQSGRVPATGTAHAHLS